MAIVTRGSSGTSDTLETYVATSPDDRSPARAVTTHSSRSNRSKIFVNASTPTIVAPHKFDPNDGPILRYFAVRCQSELVREICGPRYNFKHSTCSIKSRQSRDFRPWRLL